MNLYIKTEKVEGYMTVINYILR